MPDRAELHGRRDKFGVLRPVPVPRAEFSELNPRLEFSRTSADNETKLIYHV